MGTMYVRSPLSLRTLEDLLIERGIDGRKLFAQQPNGLVVNVASAFSQYLPHVPQERGGAEVKP